MVEVYFLDEMKKRDLSISQIVDRVSEQASALSNIPVGALIELFNELSREIIKDSSLRKLKDSAFISMWLKKKNLEDMIKINIGNYELLDKFIEIKENYLIKAQPRGTVCHWVAGNIQTLSLLSFVQSALCKNVNIMRVPKNSLQISLDMLSKLNDLNIEFKGKKYSGNVLARSLAIIYFPSTDDKTNREFSLSSDCRILWGSKETIKSLKTLPTREHCEDVIYGPKYSFGVFDKDFIEGELFEKTLYSCVRDICLFDQTACSSPHVIFFEKNNIYNTDLLAKKLSDYFSRYYKEVPKHSVPEGIAAKIINLRGEYLLDEKKNIFSSKDLKWTILINKNPGFEEPVQYATVYLKEIISALDVLPYITKKIQTVCIGIKNKEKMMNFSDSATKLGVARCVRFGVTHHYDSPWDGIMVLNRLVRFVTIKQ